jgi:peptidoglycan hydrolase-like protein with peptidoglycan-binding domain
MLRLLGGKVVEEYRLNFGELDPIDEVSGVQQRLNNLGYDCAITGELDEQTKDAMSSFRAEKNLPESDAIDDDLRGALVDAHGS